MNAIRLSAIFVIFAVSSILATPVVADEPDVPPAAPCESFWWPYYEHDEWCELMLLHDWRFAPDHTIFYRLWVLQWCGDFDNDGEPDGKEGDGWYDDIGHFDPAGETPCEGC